MFSAQGAALAPISTLPDRRHFAPLLVDTSRITQKRKREDSPLEVEAARRKVTIWHAEDSEITRRVIKKVIGGIECTDAKTKETLDIQMRTGDSATAFLSFFKHCVELEAGIAKGNKALELERDKLLEEVQSLVLIILDNTLIGELTGITLALLFKGVSLTAEQKEEFKKDGFDETLPDIQKILHAQAKMITDKTIIINSDEKEKYATSMAKADDKAVLDSVQLIPKPLKIKDLLETLQQAGAPNYIFNKKKVDYTSRETQPVEISVLSQKRFQPGRVI